MSAKQNSLETPYEIELPCVKVTQPIGDFYIATIDSASLIQITFADVRRMSARDVDEYLGIQREVNQKRVKEIGKYVNTIDACFPTAVILAVDGKCAEYNEATRTLKLKTHFEEGDPENSVNQIQIAKVLDGQHRIEGLRDLKPGHGPFQVNVSIFIEMDIESQAYLFSVVNLAQTKVNKSLVYDLFEYSKARSPQKTTHQIAVALDRDTTSPLHGRIKRLGVATEGRFTETITQATFVESLIPYITGDAISDRDASLRGRSLQRPNAAELQKHIFRGLFIEERDIEIAEIVYNYFSAVAERWPIAWSRGGGGAVLPKTNGFRALMRLLRPVYLYLADPGAMVTKEEFAQVINRAAIRDDEFVVDNFKPGTSGETALYHRLAAEMKL